MLISSEKLSELKNSVDIVEIISEYLPLKKAGKRFKALCPFHPDKDPSFYVNPERQNYKCFGCGSSGDIISFLQAVDHLSFPDTIRILARRGGINIEINESSGKTSTILKVNEFACRYFSYVLFDTEEGKPALEYLNNRGIENETAKEFRLGFAPAGWDSLKLSAQREKLNDNNLLEAGLLTQTNKGTLIDFFRQRLIFPILDTQSRVIAFGGRVLDNSLPKYINSPETPLFRKSETLYGLNLAKSEAFAKRCVIVTEGYTDVIMSHSMGINNVVATLGTAFTENHARVLKRLVDTVYVVFDSDSAGKKAAERSLEMLLGQELGIRVIQLPSGSDLFDYLASVGTDGFEKLKEEAVEFLEFKYQNVTTRHNLATTKGRADAADELLSVLRSIGNPVLRDLEIKKVSNLIGADETGLRARLGQRESKAEFNAYRKTKAYEAIRDIDLIDILLNRPDLAPRVAEAFPPESYDDTDFGHIASVLYREYQEKGTISTESVFDGKDKEHLREKILNVVRYRTLCDDNERNYEKILAAWVARKEEEHLAHEIRNKGETPAAAIMEYFELKKRISQKHKV